MDFEKTATVLFTFGTTVAPKKVNDCSDGVSAKFLIRVPASHAPQSVIHLEVEGCGVVS